MTTPNLILIRHCQATGQEPDAPLTEFGQHQAQTLADFLTDYPIDHITTSEYLRARHSIEPFAHMNGMSIDQDDRFNERILSTEPIEHWQDIVKDSFDDHDLRAPGGESANEVLRRAWSGLNEVIGAGYEMPLVVTHGNLLALVLHSIDPAFGFQGWKSLTNPDVFVLGDAGSGRMTFERIWNG
ncbi:MAG: histidine phosphatase family protein [Chloroflexi bacterium]|nr:histidine phosphatase family protein [Chloroflexota bacterium]